MFDQELLSFYRKFLLLRNGTYNFKAARPCINNSGISIDFVFEVESHPFIIKYSCTNISKETAHEHSKNINEIFRICISADWPMPLIFPCYCATCGKLYWSTIVKESRETESCLSCRKMDINKILEGEKPEGTSYVYLMHDRARNRLKIGYSNNPNKRLKQLQTGNASDIVLVSVIIGGGKLERKIHRMFSDFRVKNEWFQYNDDIVDFFNNTNTSK